MIKFEQVGAGAPKDVKVTTDDHDGELAAMDTALRDAFMEESQAFVNLAAAVLDDTAEFVIPGGEVSEVADAFAEEEIMLIEHVERWNDAVFTELED